MVRSKRRILVVNPNMQKRFAYFSITVSALGGSVVILLVGAYALRIEMGARVDGFTLLFGCIITLLAQSVFLYRYAMRISNRLAGPIYRISRELVRVAEGNFNVTIQLRKNDEWFDFASDVNTIIGRLRESRASLKKSVEHAQNLVVDGKRDEALELLEKVRTSLDDTIPSPGPTFPDG